jgi:type II secretory pathway pseudopilin PulG
MTAGMLIPALAKAKDKAQRINCVNNLRQIGLAARMYANDHEEVFPKDFQAMQQELNSPKILFCPADPDKPTPLPTDWAQVDPDSISYKFLIPGEKADDNGSEQAAFRCPIHDNVCYADGHVEAGPH